MSVVNHDDMSNEQLAWQHTEPGDVVLIGAFGPWRVFPAGIRLLGKEVDEVEGASPDGASYWTHSFVVTERAETPYGDVSVNAVESTKIPERHRTAAYADTSGNPRWHGPQWVRLVHRVADSGNLRSSPARKAKRDYLNENFTPNLGIIKMGVSEDELSELRDRADYFLSQAGFNYPGVGEIAGTYSRLLQGEEHQADAYPETLYCNEFSRLLHEPVSSVFQQDLSHVDPSRTLPEHVYQAAKAEGLDIHQVVRRPEVENAPGERIAKSIHSGFKNAWHGNRSNLPDDLFG